MSESTRSIIFNEDIYKSLTEKQRSVFIYQWLCDLREENICECHSQIIERLWQLMCHVSNSPSRILIGENLARLVSEPLLLIETINHCLHCLRTNNELAQLTAVVVIGVLCEHLDRFYQEILHILISLLRDKNSQMRYEVLITLGHVINGFGATNREIYHVVQTSLCDRMMLIRSAAALCLTALIHQNNSMYTNEFEGNVTLALRAFEGSNYQVRCAIGKYLAIVLVKFQSLRSENSMSESTDIHSKIEKMLNYLAEAFLHVKAVKIAQNQVRIGVTHTYLALISLLGREWIEEHFSLLIHHLIELVGSPQLTSSHLDRIFLRKCIACLLRSIINSCHNGRTQFSLAKEFSNIIARYAITQPISSILTNDFNQSPLYSSTHSMIQSYGSVVINQFEDSSGECQENILICVLEELSLLIQRLETSTLILLQEICCDLIDILLTILRNSSQSVRLSAAWCFRSIVMAVPSLLTQLIDQFWEKIQELTKEVTCSNTDAMSGYALALQALLGSIHQCSLGISSERVKMIFDFADHLLRTTIASTVDQEQSIIPRLILQRTSIAWHLLSACCTIDQSLRKKFLPRLLQLWRNVFPRTLPDFEREKQRGDCLTWLLSFHQRSGALCSMNAFLNSCLIAKEDSLVIHSLPRMINVVNHAIVILFQIHNFIRQFGQQLKTVTTIFRLRLYELLLLIPSQFYERYLEQLAKELIAEFTLMDSPSNTTTSLLNPICQDLLTDHWLEDADHHSIEEQLDTYSSTAFGALEHDETYLYRQDHSHSNGFHIPEPLPIYITVIDASIQLYSRIFTHISNAQRVTIFQSFTNTIKQSKDGRQEAIQINILTAVVLSLKNLAEIEQISSCDDDFKECACTLIVQRFNHTNPIIRCLAAEAFGHLISILADQYSISSTLEHCLDHLKESRDIPTRIGYSLALACAYRYSDHQIKEQYLNVFIPIFQKMMEDQSRSTLQIWALRGLILIADSSEDMNSNSIGMLIDRIVQILLCKSSLQVDISHYCGQLLNSLMLNMGSDLQTNTKSISKLRSTCLTAIHLLQMHSEPVIQAEAIEALQQLYISAPLYVNLSTLIQKLLQGLISSHSSLRRACISSLCQLSRREAKQVYEHVKLLLHDDGILKLGEYQNLEELLFSLLDTEIETNICSSIRTILINLLQTIENDDLSHWLQLCYDILISNQFDLHDQTSILPQVSSDSDDDATDSNNQFPPTTVHTRIYHRKSTIRWSTKIFAIHCIQTLIKYCEQTSQSNTSSSTEYLLVHFPIFISSSIVACTSKHDSLRLAGFELLKQIILIFTRLEESADLTIHRILKHYQRQIGAALRPAFSRQTSSNVTIEACDLCWIWISSQCTPDLHDLRRVHQILLASLQKLTSLQEQCNKKNNMIFHENAGTMEILAILKLWADVYTFVIEQAKEKPIRQLLPLIQRELYVLVHHWLAVLTDYATFILSIRSNKTENSHSFESIKTVTCSSIIQATTQWLVDHHFELELSPTNQQLINYGQRDVLMAKLLTSMNKSRRIPEKKEDIFIILLTCSTHVLSISLSDQTIDRSLSSLMHLLQSEIAHSQINIKISLELIDVLHRLCSVRTDLKTQSKVLTMIHLLFHISSKQINSIVDKDSIESQASFLSNSLKFIVSILLNYFPTIANDFQSYSTPIELGQDHLNNPHIVDFLLSSIQLLDQFIQLFSPNQNFQNLISTIVHLFLSISNILLSSNSDKLLSVIFQIFKHLFPIVTNHKISHTAMMEMIDFQEKVLEKNISDHGYFLRCLTSFIINCPAIDLSQQIVDFYRKMFEDTNAEIHHQCLQCLDEFFQSTNLPLRNQFIRIFSPLLSLQLKQTSDPQEIIEILKIFEKLLSLCDSSSRLRLASVIIPIFIHLLPDSKSSTIQINEHLTHFILERLQYHSSMHPKEFSSVIQHSPDLQTKLTNVMATPISSIPLQIKWLNLIPSE